MADNKTYHQIIQKSQQLLLDNPEWIDRYHKYAIAILDNLNKLKAKKAKFNEWAPLYLYMNITEAKGSLLFSLRYLGQDVAKIKVKGDDITISTKGFDDRNKRDFNCTVVLNDIEWRSPEATLFRKHFLNNPARNNIAGNKGNEEHRIESLLLTEFTKNIGEQKLIRNIQPVKIGGLARFQMPTPLGASNIDKLKYSGSSGGGIDILSRLGKSAGVQLSIMEVKDENVATEPPEKVIQQGLIYATFIRELLRSKSGNLWWEIFGFKRSLPQTLNLSVVATMPYLEGTDNSFAQTSIPIANDFFHLDYLYFKEENNQLSEIKTSLKQCET